MLSEKNKMKEPVTKHTILIKSDDEKKKPFSDESWSKVVKDSIEPKLKNVPVSKTIRTKDGFGVLFFPNIKQRDLAASNLKDTCKLEPQNRDVKSILPKLKINGIPADNFLKIEKQTIKQAILDKNPTIKDLVENHDKTLEVLFFKEEQNTKYCFAVIKVDIEVKNAIFSQGKKIFIGLSSCWITERHHILQCYKCQQFGHKKGAVECKLNNVNINVCLYCSNNHSSKSCPVKGKTELYKCINCEASTDASIKSSCVGHTTTFINYPSFQQALFN